jgi:hypothetical protein
MPTELKQHLTARATWMRGLYVLIFGVIFGVSEVVLWAVVIFQFLFTLFGGEPNARLLVFGRSLATFIYQIVSFLTFTSDERPFPFGPWPDGAAASAPSGSSDNRPS